VNEPCVVIAPPHLLDENNPGSWPNVFREFGVRGYLCESLGKLESLLDRDLQRFTTVFIDESHRFRTEDTQSYEMLAQICRGKRVVLVSATPLNNTPQDILSQIKLFQPGRNSTIPNVRNLEGFFGELRQRLKSLDRKADRDAYFRTVKENAGQTREKPQKLVGDCEAEPVGFSRREVISRSDLETFVRLGEQISHYEAVKARYSVKMPKNIERHARLIDQKLAEITVCDPAVGSGAFPVGMMTEIVRARSALTPYFNDVHERTPYHFKRHAIQTCLYGVDIDPGAVEIAKLRLTPWSKQGISTQLYPSFAKSAEAAPLWYDGGGDLPPVEGTGNRQPPRLIEISNFRLILLIVYQSG
jgi:hypothetical protein